MGIFGKVFGDKKFEAALNVLMAEYTHRRLSHEKYLEVLEYSHNMMRQLGYGGQEALTLAAMPRGPQNAVYATAMNKLGIKPAILGEDWRTFGNPFKIDAADDEEALEKAYEYIKETHGIDIYSYDEDE